jgi:adenine-specific DNA methylase
MGKLDEVDTKELGEAVDMIKDLCEAMYYTAITEAMEDKKDEKKEHHYYIEPTYRDMDRSGGRMYYSEPHMNNNPTSRMYTEREYAIPMRDTREGKSPMSRKTYMETREMHADKATIMKELEKYVQELSRDMVEMIEEASPEERHYLEKRISALATKIGQMNA